MSSEQRYPVLDQVSLPDEHKAVLHDITADQARLVHNVICEAADGTRLWIASPGEFGPDAFVSVHGDGEMLSANTWSG
jgi:hypothetical protein